MRIFTILLIVLMFGCKSENKETIESKPLEVSDNEIVNYIPYCNDRFDICFDYPSNFGAQPEPANGDGRTFLNKIDSAEIVMYGYIDENNQGLEKEVELRKEYLQIESLTKLDNGYELIAIDKDSGFMHKERIFIKPDSKSGTYDSGKPLNVIYSLQFTYPANKKNKYQHYWTKMIKNLK